MSISIDDVECLAILDSNGVILTQSSQNPAESTNICKELPKIPDEITIINNKVIIWLLNG